MSNILEKITSSNIIFFSIIGVLVLIIIIMIVLIRKENKNKLNDILDQSKAIKVLDEKEITDTVAIPNLILEMNMEVDNNSDVVTIPNLDENVEPVNDFNMNNNLDFSSGATINDTISLPKVEDDEEIQPIVNPFDISIESEDLKTLDEIDSFTKEIELPSLKEDYNEMVVTNFELPSLKEDKKVDLPDIVNEAVDTYVPQINLPEIENPLVEEQEVVLPQVDVSEIEVPKIEVPEIELPEIKMPEVEISREEIPEIVNDSEIDYPDNSIDVSFPEEENVLPVIEEVDDIKVNERSKIDIQSIDFSPIEVELPKSKEDISPVINEEDNLPFILSKEEDDEDDGKYEYDEDIEEEDEGVPLSELDDEVVTDDNLAELASKLEERVLPDVVKLTSYEEKQEEEAIISYDELLSKTDTIKIEDNEREMEKQAIDIRDINDDNYSYEEDFLSSLKDLRDSLK